MVRVGVSGVEPSAVGRCADFVCAVCGSLKGGRRAAPAGEDGQIGGDLEQRRGRTGGREQGESGERCA